MIIPFIQKGRPRVEPCAHSQPNAPQEAWQTLQAHSKAVAAMAAAFAAPFMSGEHGRLLGELHDLGKALAYCV